jgi:hypothetical protein
MRNLLPATKLALGKGEVVFSALVEIDFPTPIYATDYQRVLSYDSKSFLTSSGLKEVPDIKQEFALSASSYSLVFNDDTNELLSMVANNNVHGARLDVHLVIISADDDSIIQVVPSVYRGYLENPVPLDNSRIKFEFKNHLSKLEKTSGRRTNSASQQRHFEGDRGFDLVK